MRLKNNHNTIENNKNLNSALLKILLDLDIDISEIESTLNIELKNENTEKKDKQENAENPDNKE
ncbi:MAG: hypothetical protein JXR68_08090 [Bacteroidales bacterium]|nr:hypothetical protein [Bacteroidales bacterium]